MSQIPERPTLDGLEAKWDAQWERQGVYRFDRSRPQADVYAIDTPPPTVSGQLHLGTVFGYVQTDALARFHRMRGREVFYPMGWDDNGLPTERRVQNLHNVRCDPSMPHVATRLVGDGKKGTKPLAVSRRNFVELCQEQTLVDEQAFESIFRRVGLSVDWTLTYATIDVRSRRAAQRAFLRNLQRGEAYAAEAPTLWDIDFRTAVAQAELEERDVEGAYHRLRFAASDGSAVEIETTRPELLAACVALVAHPEDARYSHLIGSEVVSPMFGVPVPVRAHPLADPEKGTGIAMVCTFGDSTDIVWWRELDLPTRAIVGRDGRLPTDPPEWLPESRADLWAEIGGRSVTQARKRIVELAAASGDLVGEPRPIVHAVKFYEKGDRPVEVVTSLQWYIRNGAQDANLREALLARGRDLRWHPEFMRTRYEHWVDGLNSDWLISRQRYFGVPFPVWYPLDGDGVPLFDRPLLPKEEDLPVDPQAEPPAGYDEAQRGAPDGFVGDPDVMDTWATSSLTPYIASGWEEDPDPHAIAFPMHLRPQGPEIIRTWLFATMLRTHLESNVLPWEHASINGWILDPDRKKMSKSKGNVVTPEQLLEEFGADGLRYWACSGAPGTDTAVDYGQMKVGRRLANKILNASRFVLGLRTSVSARPVAADPTGPLAWVTEPVDVALLARLDATVVLATESFENYDYHRALGAVETFFWSFCDDYVELVKHRAYDEEGGTGSASAHAALEATLDTLIRLMAPFLPFVTEEVWSWWRPGSVHRAPWPVPRRSPGGVNDDLAGHATEDVLSAAAAALAAVRKAKSQAQKSLRASVSRLTIRDTAERLELLRLVTGDLCRAGAVEELVLEEAVTSSVEVELQPAPHA
jgi:valyl-tRNA synthetase